MAAISAYLRPDRNVLRGGTVATSTGALDSAFTAGWLVDELVGRPVKATTGSAGWTVTIPSSSLSGLAVVNHNIDGGRTITLGGGLSTTISAPAARPNGVPYNALYWPGSTLTGLTSVSVTVASNSAALVIGELMAGVFSAFPGNGLLINGMSGANLRRGTNAGARSVRPYDDGSAARRWRSSVIATAAELDDLMAWFEAQKNGTLPSLFVPDNTKNDVWAVDLQEPEWTFLGTRFRVTLTLHEYPRERW